MFCLACPRALSWVPSCSCCTSTISVSSHVKLYIEDTLICRIINSAEDITILQRDLNTLSEWANKWLMSFNPSKYVHLTITHKTNPLKSSYSICGSVIQQSNSAKYLRVTITSNLSWSEHINNITNKANSIRVFLQRNLNQCHKSLKSTCYISYVRLILSRICLICLVKLELSTDLKWSSVVL